MDESRITLSKNLKILRKSRRMKQTEVAQLSDIDYKYYQKIEGKTPPNITLKTLDKLADVLDTPTWSLLIVST